MLSKKALHRFFDIYKEVFGDQLPEAEATEKAERLIRLYLAVYGSPLDNYKNNHDEHEK